MILRHRTPVFVLAAAALALAWLPAAPALAWGATGHRIIGRVATAALPETLPAFLRSQAAIDQIGELAREPDRSKGSGQPHDSDLDPAHFIDLTDDGGVLGGPSLDAMPANLDAYDVALHAGGSSMIRSGYLYYSLLDGYEQLVRDFADWRIERVALAQATDPAQLAWLTRDLALREALTIRDLGFWSHFVGDASMPLHTSVHYNGWGPYPNPRHFTNARLHGPFEGAFVRAYVTEAAVQAAMPAARPCEGPVAGCLVAYLRATNAEVQPLYGLWGEGVFQPAGDRAGPDAAGVAFATARVVAGAAALRDLVARAWDDSGGSEAGYPAVSVKAAEAGAPVPFGSLYGED